VQIAKVSGKIVRSEKEGVNSGRLQSYEAAGGGNAGIAPVAEPNKADEKILPNAAADCQRNPQAESDSRRVFGQIFFAAQRK